jgi:hypothetical protein
VLNKFILSDNTVLSDKTLQLSDFNLDTVTMALVTAEDAIYIGSKYPITRKFFKVGTANVVAASASVRYWDGSNWRSAVNVMDHTKTITAPLARSGYLHWETDKRYVWTRADTDDIAALSSVTLYDYYWVEITYDATISAVVPWMGDLFCTDAQLGEEYPDLLRANVLAAFETGKTDWEAQRVAASKLVIQDLKRIWKPNAAESALGPEELTSLTISKTAEIIFRGLGQGYADSKADATAEYDKRLDKRRIDSDDNNNGRADSEDTQASRVTRLYR